MYRAALVLPLLLVQLYEVDASMKTYYSGCQKLRHQRMQYLDRQVVGADCPGSAALQGFKVTGSGCGNEDMQYEYTCGQYSPTDSSSPAAGYFGPIGLAEGKQLEYLDRQGFNCPENTALQYFHLTRENNNDFKYYFKCVPVVMQSVALHYSGCQVARYKDMEYLDRQHPMCPDGEYMMELHFGQWGCGGEDMQYLFKCGKPAAPSPPPPSPAPPPLRSQFQLRHSTGCGDHTKLSQTVEADKQDCSDLCASHHSCEFFLWGLGGPNSDNENYCRLAKGSCTANEQWQSWETYDLISVGSVAAAVPPPASGSNARFTQLFDTGIKNCERIKTYASGEADLQTCANDCAADDSCELFMYGKTGFGKHGMCQLCGANCTEDSGNGGWYSYEVIDDVPMVEPEPAPAQDPLLALISQSSDGKLLNTGGKNQLVVVSAVFGCMAVVGIAAFFLLRKRTDAQGDYVAAVSL